MKIITWNVNGLRAALRKGVLPWIIEESADVMCLQETRVLPEQLTEEQRDIPGYEVFWNPAEKKGYSGTSTWTKETPREVQLGLGDARFDVEGRVIRTRHPDFYLYNIYFPNGQRGHERVDYKLEFYENLLETCNALHAAGESVIITGDFNTAHNEIDLKNHKTNHKTSGFLPEERAMIDRYMENGFVDPFRHLYPEKEQYSWWSFRGGARSRNVGWRIDYFLVSENLLPRVKDVIIHDDVLGSDHCPTELQIA
ncbi:MAG: exodeoxyribonuclease III [Anaerolineae bacterium]|jgi:exodeoxyribonuclease-3|nr:exodeoxyribonuclease III [Anaerolineae bacterium]MBT3714235.1 exodeoxyribonuclease III [Anaerolineae bacterium]MBT4310345.1 exodeoxyribonuclease III [Anaerolineae bacterium]MBT4458860.1 exodeoxyribonuclease III [Anaerolineae bacterium]MBT4842539.1 exodeoxyribonuclease III [Anaerolineae bacterium]